MKKTIAYWRLFRRMFTLKERVILGVAWFGGIISILAMVGLEFNWPPLISGLCLVIGPACLLTGLWGLFKIKTTVIVKS